MTKWLIKRQLRGLKKSLKRKMSGSVRAGVHKQIALLSEQLNKRFDVAQAGK